MSVSACQDVASDDGTVASGAAFAARAQQLTNLASAEGWLGLYHPDAVADWIVDGARERHEGIDAIRPAATLMAELWRRHRFRVRKHLQCATDDCVVLTFDGTFGGRGCVTGAEIWTFRDGLVVHHWMSVYLDARPRTSRWAQFRVLITAPRIAVTALRLQRKHAGLHGDSPTGDRVPVTDSRNRLPRRGIRK